MKHIFVVDDEQCIADTLAAILNHAGYRASPAYDAQMALSLCETSLPDLVISDVVMPGINGIEMAIQIKQRYPSCQILLFSGLAATADLLEKARCQGYHFELLAKPVHPADLLEKVAA